jgi:capsule polysaccharide export protein KpsE/RkpR
LARKKFAKHFGASVNARTSTITFNVDGRTPYAAKSAADTLLSRLNSVIIDLRRRRASAERAFVERRLDSASTRQTALEDTLRWFYATNRLIANSPNLQFAEARLKRRVEFALDLANQLRTQLETAKLQEVRDTPVLSVITPPELPGKKSAPNRRLILFAALLLGAGAAALDFAIRRDLLRDLLR